MKKVLTGHEEQNIANTNINQSTEVLNLDIDNSINMKNETLVRIFEKILN